MIHKDTIDTAFFVSFMTALALAILLVVRLVVFAECQDTFHPGLDTRVQCGPNAALSLSQDPPGWVCTCIREPAQPDAPVEALP